MSSSKKKGDVTINDLEIGSLLIQILIFDPRMALLAHIHTYVDNMEVQLWANRGIISTASSVGPVIQDIALDENH